MTTDEEIAKLKARVDEIEHWINDFADRQNAILRARQAYHESPEPEDSFEIVSLDIKPVDQVGSSATYAYKLEVRNLSDKSIKLHGKIAFYDAAGFELKNDVVGLFQVPAKQSCIRSGQAHLSHVNNFQAIADIKAVLQTL